jgi:hypothetical protein
MTQAPAILRAPLPGRARTWLFVTVALALLAPARAEGQDPGAYASFVPSMALSDASASLALSGTFGVRFNRAVAFELELTSAPDFARQRDFGVLPLAVTALSIFPAQRFDLETRAVLFLTNARVFIPTTLSRVRPFVVAGGGLAHVRQDVAFSWTASATGGIGNPQPLRLTGTGGDPFVPNASLLFPQLYQTTSADLALALTLGGGASVDVWKGLSVDVDLRYYRLMGQRDWNVGRFGVGAGYRF